MTSHPGCGEPTELDYRDRQAHIRRLETGEIEEQEEWSDKEHGTYSLFYPFMSKSRW